MKQLDKSLSFPPNPSGGKNPVCTDNLTHGDLVTSKKFHHEERMIFCCLHPSTPKYAIVVRGDGRLSELFPVTQLVPYDEVEPHH